ncbi:MAG: COP23 domain-containing protein [Hormoscilla sp.]
MTSKGLFVQMLAVLALVLGATTPSKAQEQQFFCGTDYNYRYDTTVPATIARTTRGDVPMIHWVSYWASNSGWTPQRRCQAIANRFQRYYDNGMLKYMRTGIVNGYRVICVGTSTGGSCRPRDVLVTLKWGRNPALILEQMTDLRRRARGEILELNYDGSETAVREQEENENPDGVSRESLLLQEELLSEDEVLFYVDGEAYLDMEVFLNQEPLQSAE